MALNGLLDIEISVPEPAELTEFWARHGLARTEDGVLGTHDRPVQISVREGAFRHLSRLHLSCESENDIAGIASRLADAGLGATVTDTSVECTDPVFGHKVVVDVTAPHPLTPAQQRAVNAPGQRGRIDSRADAVVNQSLRAPRRVGHVVLGTPHLDEAYRFYLDILGFRVSDQIRKIATFARCESDHHNLLIQPSKVSYLNHYALEMDDLDAVGRAGTAVVAERDDASVVGVGRHNLGSNIFWYLTDPSGGMFEFFADMDQIIDDDAWERDVCRRDWEGADGPAGFSVWGPVVPPAEFFRPPDLVHIAAGREAAGLRA